MPLIKGKSQNSFVKNLKTEMESGKPQKQSLAIAYAMKRKAQKKANGGMMKYADGDEVGATSALQPKDNSAQDSMRQAFHYPPAQSKTAQADPTSPQNKGRVLHPGETAYSKGGQVESVSGLEDTIHSLDHEKPGIVPDSPQYEFIPTQHNVLNVAARGEDSKRFNQRPVDMHASTEMAHDDLVDRIMNRQSEDFSDAARLAYGGVPSPDAGPSYMNDEMGMTDKEMYMKSKDYADLDRYSEGGKVANQEHGKDNNEMAGFSPNEFDDLVLRDDLKSSYGDDDNAGDSLDNDQENEDRKDIVARIMKSRAKKDRNPNPA